MQHNFHQFRFRERMALSRFEYVKKFEKDDSLLRDCWIVVRIDGKGKDLIENYFGNQEQISAIFMNRDDNGLNLSWYLDLVFYCTRLYTI